MGYKRYILIAFFFGVLIGGIYYMDYVLLPIAISSLFVLIFFKKIALKIGFTKGILAYNGVELDGEKHTIDLQGYNSDKALNNNNKVMLVVTIPAIVITLLSDVFGISEITDIIPTITISALFPFLFLWIYLITKDLSNDKIKSGITTIEVIP